MVNVNKIKALSKEKGVKQGYLCEQLGKHFTYLNDIAKGKTSMPLESIEKVAAILETTVAYLTDETDDPAPTKKEPVQALSEEEDLILQILRTMTVEEKLDLIEYLKRK